MAEVKSVAKDTAIYGLKKQHHRKVPELFAGPALYGQDDRGKRRLWHRDQHLCLRGAFDGHPHVRHGNHAVPFLPSKEGKIRKPSMARHSPWWAAFALCCLPCSYWLSLHPTASGIGYADHPNMWES